MKKYSRVATSFFNRPLAILEEKAEEIAAFLNVKLAGGDIAPEQAELVAAENRRPSPKRSGTIAVLPLYGVIAQRMDMFMEFSGGTSTEQFGAALDELVENEEIKAIVIDVESPGGSVTGVPELFTKIMEAREKKYIVAVANSMAASAAYWLSSAANEIYVTPSGEVGSIGVITVHEDYSKAYEEAGIKPTIIKAGKRKWDANYYEPLSDEAKSAIQEDVDEFYGMFISSVAKGRGVSVETVRNEYGQGLMLTAKKALKAGMVDGIATLDEVLKKLGAGHSTTSVYRGNENRKKMLELYQ